MIMIRSNDSQVIPIPMCHRLTEVGKDFQLIADTLPGKVRWIKC